MRYLPNVLLILALPAGVIGYGLAARLVESLALPEAIAGIAILFIPLFVGGLCMLPFIAPWFDRMAKRDLAAHRKEQEEAAARDGSEPPRD